MDNKIEERSFVRILGRMCLSGGDMKLLKAIVDKRNQLAHANGEVVFKQLEELESCLDDMLLIGERMAVATSSELKEVYRTDVGRFIKSELAAWYNDPTIEERFVKNWYINQLDISKMLGEPLPV